MSPPKRKLGEALSSDDDNVKLSTLRNRKSSSSEGEGHSNSSPYIPSGGDSFEFLSTPSSDNDSSEVEDEDDVNEDVAPKALVAKADVYSENENGQYGSEGVSPRLWWQKSTVTTLKVS